MRPSKPLIGSQFLVRLPFVLRSVCPVTPNYYYIEFSTHKKPKFFFVSFPSAALVSPKRRRVCGSRALHTTKESNDQHQKEHNDRNQSPPQQQHLSYSSSKRSVQFSIRRRPSAKRH
ncbi:hypothetical protein niasHT_036759 [Heterodera trifolii]|uniref:Uncharacterized protein n=1 Tax=Heterodera trifolii TaxID=157864 RepID=A0ABD2IWR6_9BILA